VQSASDKRNPLLDLKMAPSMSIQEAALSTTLASSSDSFEPSKDSIITLLQKTSGVMAIEAFDDDAETTDMGGNGSASDSESASGLSSSESSHGVSKPCRFGSTPLETIPATPVASKEFSPASPPGLSRASMRQQRDAFRLRSSATATSLTSGRQCRFGSSSLQTVPATPPKVAKFKALAKNVGSPPGLSRASMRQARDACKVDAPATSSWGSYRAPSAVSSASPLLTISPVDAPMTPAAVRSAKRREAREAMMQRAKLGAELLRAEAEAIKKKRISEAASEEETESSIQGSDSEHAPDMGSTSASEDSSSESSAPDGRRCRFGCTVLETVPPTPLANASPPGLSRAAMRQARDACKPGRVSAPSWGSTHTSTASLVFTPCTMPMTTSAAAPR